MRARIEKFDHAAMLAVSRRRHPTLTALLRVLTWTGQGWWWGACVITLWLGIRFDFLRFPHREFTLFATLAPGIAWIFVQALKLFFRRRRPFQILDDYRALTPAPSDDSFPSGHTASVFAFTVAMAPLGPAVAGPLAFWSAVVAFSRYYLGVHFPSDIVVGALIGIAAGAGMAGIRGAAGADHYPSYVELAKHEKAGGTYAVEVRDRKSEILVLAIHGGELEKGTAELAEAIAGADWNAYVFRVLPRDCPKNSDCARELHVTSTHFDDPRAIALTAKSRLCISVHGYKDTTEENVCLGGGNRDARARVEAELRKAFPKLSLAVECKGIAGTDAKNIVNRCREKGVQLELSQRLRDRLAREASDAVKFAAAVRSATVRGN